MIKVLIVEPKSAERLILSVILESAGIKVVKVREEEDVMKKLIESKPDVVLLDIEQKKLSGLDILYNIMLHHPVPVVVFGRKEVMVEKEMVRAFSYGAVDFFVKPDIPKKLFGVKDEIVSKVVDASKARVYSLRRIPLEEIHIHKDKSDKVIGIGASSGGPGIIEKILMSFPHNFPAPIIVVQHLPPYFSELFAKRLDKLCEIKVEEARNFTKLKPSKAYIAPSDQNIEVIRKECESYIVYSNKESMSKPSIDIAFESLGREFRDKAIGVILSGLGNDGTRGAEVIKMNGGIVIAQDESTSVVFGMPKSIIERGLADYVLPFEKISKKIVELL